MNSNTSCKNQIGFTLIELMITVAVIAIITSVAYPSYSSYVAKGRRAEAQSLLLAGAQWMERFYSENYRYDQNSAGTAVTDASLFPSRFSTSPPSGQSGAAYSISVTVTNGVRDAYLITASRIAGSSMGSDMCGDFTIDQLGRKSIQDGTWSTTKFSSKAAAISSCWK